MQTLVAKELNTILMPTAIIDTSNWDTLLIIITGAYSPFPALSRTFSGQGVVSLQKEIFGSFTTKETKMLTDLAPPTCHTTLQDTPTHNTPLCICYHCLSILATPTTHNIYTSQHMFPIICSPYQPYSLTTPTDPTLLTSSHTPIVWLQVTQTLVVTKKLFGSYSKTKIMAI